MLTPLSRAGVGIDFRPAVGRFAGGAGGVGLALTAAAVDVPFVAATGAAFGAGGGGVGRRAGAICSSK
jgi:hypothetical protein